jgi:hypothetical protein
MMMGQEDPGGSGGRNVTAAESCALYFTSG